jgi:uncharacterized RDD family membrane protein YckC
MEIITVHTTQNIDIDYEIGGLGERILARLIDFGVFIPFVIAGMFLATALSSMGIGIYFIIVLVLFTFYDLVSEVFFNGQSAGKRIMKIRVISIDGARPKFSQYLLRWLFRLVDFSITGGLAALITSAVSEKGQRVGDIVAGTALIKTIPRTKMDNLIFKTAADDYQPVFTQVSQLNDQDISLVYEVIQSYLKSGNTRIVYTMADKMRQYLSISLPPNMDSMQFLQTILKDYSHITAHADAL